MTNLRATIWTIGVLAATFAAGIAVGESIGSGGTALPSRRPPTPTGGPDLVPQVRERLEVSAVQRRQIDSILQLRRRQTEEMLGGTMARLSSVVDSTATEVRAILTIAQRDAFDSLMTLERASIRLRTRRPAPPPNAATPPDSAR